MMELFKKPIFKLKLSKRQLISLASLLIILISLPLAIFLVKQQQIYRGRTVPPEARPINVTISNLHGGGFSVSWVSVDKSDNNQFIETTGWVKYGTSKNNLDKTAYDDRGGENFSSTTHHVSIFNLKQKTTYYFKIKSGPQLYGLNVAGDRWVKGGAAKEQKTPKTLELTGNPQPIYGFIKDQSGNKVAGALVYVRLKKDDSETKSALMSTVTKANEGWVMDAKNARGKGLRNFFDFDNNDRVLINVQAGRKGEASVDFAISDCSPAQDITLVPSVTPTPTPTSTPTPTPTVTPTPTLTPTPEPGKAHLTFMIKFQGITKQRSNKTVKITLKKEGNIVDAKDIRVSSNQNGVYTGKIMNVTPDTYDIYIKGWAHLQKKFESITLTEGENTQDWSETALLAGDADGSDRVDSLDFTILVGHYIPHTPADSPADFNLDGRVDSLDFTLLAGNYYQEGEK